MVSRKEVTQINDAHEMDILVAEQIMGWQKETDEAELKRLDKYFSQREGRIWWRKPEGGWHYEPSAFSSDIYCARPQIELFEIERIVEQDVQSSRFSVQQPKGWTLNKSAIYARAEYNSRVAGSRKNE